MSVLNQNLKHSITYNHFKDIKTLTYKLKNTCKGSCIVKMLMKEIVEEEIKGNFLVLASF